MYNGGLNKIIKENSDKLKYSPKGITTGLPESSWLDKYKMGGGLYTRKVTCSNCGHSWKGVDGGEDPMTCHKCGGMIKMKNGGDISVPNVYPDEMIPKFDEGGLVSCPPGQVWSEKLKKCVDSRGFWDTFSQFVPGYETYLDVKDVVQGATTGNTAQKNQGIIGLAQPVAGKAVTNLLDYVTEKLLGKDVADEIAERRQGVVNMSDKERIALFKKYGFGGYEKWVKDGKPPLYELGGGTGPYPNFPSTGMLTRNVTGPKVPTMKHGGEPWTAKYKF